MNDSEYVELYRKWILSPADFIQTMIIGPYNTGTGRSIFITGQQAMAIEEVRKVVTAKLKRSEGVELSDEEVGYGKKFGISVMAGKGLGKDACASWLILWFMMCFPNCKIPCTSVSADQLNKVLWSEIGKWLQHSPAREFLTLENSRLYFNRVEEGMAGRRWFAFPKTANPKASVEEQVETLAGIHEDFVMLVVDEASGIPDAVFDPLESTLTGKCNFIFMIFNPTRSKGYAADSHGKDAAYWICLRWNAEESELADKQVIERIALKYGKDSNPYRIRVLGLPPLVDEMTLFPADWVMDAVGRELEPLESSPVIKGLDCGAGGDKSVIATRKGGKIYELKRFNTPDSQALINWAQDDFLASGADVLRVDNIGIGWAVYGGLFDRLGAVVEAADSRRRADNPDKFINKRAEMYWSLREKFEHGAISLPDDQDLVDQLLAIKASYDGGKTRIVEKAKIKKELGHSPDELDALAMTYYSDDILFGKQARQGVERTGQPNSWLGA